VELFIILIAIILVAGIAMMFATSRGSRGPDVVVRERVVDPDDRVVERPASSGRVVERRRTTVDDY